MYFQISSLPYPAGKRENNTIIQADSAEEAVAITQRRGNCGWAAQDIRAVPLSVEEIAAHLAGLDDGDDAYGGPNHDI